VIVQGIWIERGSPWADRPEALADLIRAGA